MNWTIAYCDPNRHIPEFITEFTGIDDAMVREVLCVRDVARELEAFVGDLPIVGHNVLFHLGFLEKQIPFSFNEVNRYIRISIYSFAELSAVITLGACGKELGIAMSGMHIAH